MANENIPNDTYRPGAPPRSGLTSNDPRPGLAPDDPSLAGPNEDALDARFEREAQVDPELTEGRASTGKIALFALAIALVLGAVFYGLNSSRVEHASTAPPARTAQTPPANPNNTPGVTTGSAVTNHPTPPQSAPQGTEANRSGNPPAANSQPNK